MLDCKPYIRHHPTIGYEYVPASELVLPQPGGGEYTLRVNSAGIRSDREYAPAKPSGVTRLLVFGDSFAAGQYVSNHQRFSEQLERRRPKLEVINFALEGTGTDQQLLLYEEVGPRYEHDAVLLFPFLQNIRRNLAEARESFDPVTHEQVLIAKPRFELAGGALQLRNVPVPAKRPKVAEVGLRGTDANTPAQRVKSWLNQFRAVRYLKRQAFRIAAWEPFPEYQSAAHPAWKLMAAILNRFHQAAGPRPLILVPVFYAAYLYQNMARNYLARFQEVAAELPRVYVVDTLPAFQSLGTQEGLRCFFHPIDAHYSPQGHLVLATVLDRELTRLGLLPTQSCNSQSVAST